MIWDYILGLLGVATQQSCRGPWSEAMPKEQVRANTARIRKLVAILKSLKYYCCMQVCKRKNTRWEGLSNLNWVKVKEEAWLLFIHVFWDSSLPILHWNVPIGSSCTSFFLYYFCILFHDDLFLASNAGQEGTGNVLHCMNKENNEGEDCWK